MDNKIDARKRKSCLDEVKKKQITTGRAVDKIN